MAWESREIARQSQQKKKLYNRNPRLPENVRRPSEDGVRIPIMKRNISPFIVLYHPTNPEVFVNARNSLVFRNIKDNEKREVKLHSAATSLDWCDNDLLIIGKLNGNVSLLNVNTLMEIHDFSYPSSLSEVSCTGVTCNMSNQLLVAASYECSKKKITRGVLVWDRNENTSLSTTESEPPTTNANFSYYPSKPPSPKPKFRPRYGFLEGENASCLTWKSLHCIIVGTNSYLKGVDLRDPSKLILNQQAHANTVRNVKLNPHNPNLFASCAMNAIKIWDFRKPKNPLLRIQDDAKREIVQIEWSPVVDNIIASTASNDVIKMWNITGRNLNVSSSYRIREYKSIYPFIKAGGNVKEEIHSFSLHPTDRRKMVCASDSYVVPVHVSEHRKFGFGPRNQLAIGGRDKFHVSEKVLEGLENIDMVKLMRERAERGFGMNAEKNCEISKEIKRSKDFRVWSWMVRVKKLSKRGWQHYEIGVEQVLRMKGSRMQNIPYGLPRSYNYLKNLEEKKEPKLIEEYESQVRSICIALCGWYDLIMKVKECIQNNQRHKYLISERGVALSLFNQDIASAKKLLMMLDSGGKSRGVYQAISFALMGWELAQENKKLEIGKEVLLENIKDPYLRCSFKFLFTRDIKEALSSCNDIILSDRVALYCKYLKDEELLKTIQKLGKLAKDRGNLEGLLITGLSLDHGLRIIRRYVDLTTDIQMPCLLFLQNWKSSSSERRNRLILRLLFEYRNLLNRWKLWEQRSLLDSTLSHMNVHSDAFDLYPMFPKIDLECSFCKMKKNKKDRALYFYQTKNPINKRFYCQSCKNPLSRCSICLMPFGLTSLSLGDSFKKNVDQVNSFDYAYAWCQKCRHGGHIIHLRQWFADHETCAVSKCSCRCDFVDYVS